MIDATHLSLDGSSVHSATPEPYARARPADGRAARYADELSDADLEHVVGGLARAWSNDVVMRPPAAEPPSVLVMPMHAAAQRISA